MIRALATRGARKMAILGIDAENVKRLRKGEPIIVALDDLGAGVGPRTPELGPIDVVICFGETLDDITRELEGLIGLGTSVYYDPRIPNQGKGR